MKVNEAEHMKDLELENNKLKRILAEKLQKTEALKDVILKKVAELESRRQMVVSPH